MFKNFLGRFSKDIGVDLGTANTLFFVREKGIVINIPTVVAINTRTDQLLAVGLDAKRMMGKTPPHITVIRPVENGVVADFETCEKFVKHFIEKIHRESFTITPRPRIIVNIPLDITEVERKAVQDVILGAGAREVHLVEEPLAAAIGARVNLQESVGHMIVEIGGGKTSMAVISLSGIVNGQTIRTAGDELDNTIREYVRENFNIIIGQKTAEEIKIKIGSTLPLEEPLELKVKGRNLLTGLPKEFSINDNQVREAIKRPVRTLVDQVRLTVESAPAELVADLHESGILLSGGGALLRGLDALISKELTMPVKIVDDPLTTVVRGAGILLEDSVLLKEVESVGNIMLG
ncbi:MAG: rod shape-determining protein [Candidatus Komeilibacteria bacterium RIFCSPLOWO2_02_FULL_48_11]|uniref:Cell shape-determining protein MreB n=1 Tax=Candidatus Komeilibacteria bacterium RIFCSPLOWO2_02_FULL_48_11 TaxID=1798553 RepID=A0A1G2BQE7_9BACT|nr:MAG: rod shape-determining protein [Candidatus Komeilibacteria bacterium RIFCSPLOWO2_02_FULL_48_11]